MRTDYNVNLEQYQYFRTIDDIETSIWMLIEILSGNLRQNILSRVQLDAYVNDPN